MKKTLQVIALVLLGLSAVYVGAKNYKKSKGACYNEWEVMFEQPSHLDTAKK